MWSWKPADADVQCAAYAPQHDDERRGREEGLSDAAHEIDRRFGGDAHVIGDAVFGVGVIAAHEVELVVAAVAEPAVDHAVGRAMLASAAAASCARTLERR